MLTVSSTCSVFSPSLFIDSLGHKTELFKTFPQCLSRALRDDNPRLLMAASAFLLPVRPLVVSAVHTGMMEVTHLSGPLTLSVLFSVSFTFCTMNCFVACLVDSEYHLMFSSVKYLVFGSSFIPFI